MTSRTQLGCALFASSLFLFVPAASAQQIVRVEKIRPAAPADTAGAPVHPRFVRLDDTTIRDFQMGMGSAWGDYDGDGWLDLFVSGYHRHPDLLYQNKGDGTFRHSETVAGVEAGGAAGFGCGWGDYDNDGDLDLFVVNVNQQQDFLWQNNGDGTFRNVAPDVGMSQKENHNGASWGDFDGDGNLDLFLVGGAQNMLYRNLGNGTFMDVSANAGVAGASVNGYGVAWGDYDGDKDLDIFVSRGGQDFLYRNNGNGTFTDMAKEAGMSENANGQGASWADYDNDGDLDLYVANYSGQQDFLYRNNGDGTFVQVAEKSGMKDSVDGRGVAWGDYDNDGDLDLVVAIDRGGSHILYRNNGNGTFSNVRQENGLEGGWCITPAWADFDNDGDLDLFVSTQVTHVDLFYRNDDTGANTWIKINPLIAGGAGKICPTCGQPWPGTGSAQAVDTKPAAARLAIGAWVEVDLDGGADFAKGPGRYIAALVGAGDGLSNPAIPVHLGTGSAKTVDVRVTYPTGKVARQNKVSVNRTLTVKDK